MKMYSDQTNELIDKASRDSDILAVFLFGSKARNNNYCASDVDICLVMSPFPHIANELFQKRLTYLKLFDMDIQIFQQLPIYIRIRILNEGKLLFCRDDSKLYEITFKTITEFNDFEHIYHHYLQEVLNAG